MVSRSVGGTFCAFASHVERGWGGAVCAHLTSPRVATPVRVGVCVCACACGIFCLWHHVDAQFGFGNVLGFEVRSDLFLEV